MSNVLGFEIKNNTSGDFIPIVKYHAPSGRIFRSDRVQLSDGTFSNEPVDITAIFKAVVDFDNALCGWIEFTPHTAPVMVLVPLADLKSGKAAMPDKPTQDAKNGFRCMMKLHASCSNDRPVREIAGNSSAFLNGIAAVYEEYERTREQYPGKLPVLTLVKVDPVKSGQSTNFQPVFKISGWTVRPDDLKPTPPSPRPTVQPLPLSVTAPTTGAHTVPPPNVLRSNVQLADDDFG